MTTPSTDRAGPADRAFAEFRRTGSPRAMAEVFDLTAGELLVFARRFVRDAQGADDLVQQTFLRAIERAEGFDPSRPVMPWLTTILANEARMEARSAARRSARHAAAGRGAETADPGPDRQAEQREMRTAMDHALRTLPSEQQDVVALKLLHGMPPRHIARALAVPVETVKTRFKRGLQRLTAALPAGFALGAVASVSASSGWPSLRRSVIERAAGMATGSAAVSSSFLAGAMIMTTKNLWITAACAAVLALGAWAVSRPWGADLPSNDAVAAERPVDDLADPTGAARDVPVTEPRAERASVTPPTEDAPPAALPEIVSLRAIVHARWSSDSAPAVHYPLTLTDGERTLRLLRTDGAGRCPIALELPRDRIRKIPGGYSPVTVLDTMRGNRLVATLPLAAEPTDEAQRFDYLIDDGLRVRGVVVDASGVPAAGAVVLVSHGHGEQPVARTDHRGRFDVRGLQERATLRACKGTSMSPSYDERGLASLRRAVDDPVTIRLAEAGARWTIRVETADGGPVAGAAVRTRNDPVDHDSFRIPQTLSTGADGIAVFEGLRAEHYVLEVDHPSHPPAAVVLPPAEPGQELNHTVVLGPSASVTGIVRSASGVPAVGARVRTNQLTSLHRREARTDADGHFRFDDLPLGRIEFWVWFEDHQLVEFADLHEGEQAVIVEHVDSVRIRGRLVDALGNPMSGWNIAARPVIETTQGRQTTTDPDGCFDVDELVPDRTYNLYAEAPSGGGHGVFRNATVGEMRLDYRLSAEQVYEPASLRGRFENAPEHAVLWIHRPDDDDRGHGLKADGVFAFEGLPPGPYVLALAGDTNDSGPTYLWVEEFTLASGDARDLGDLSIDERTGALTVEVVMPTDGSALRYQLTVTAVTQHEDASLQHRPRLERAHRFRIDRLLAGREYLVQLVPDAEWEDEAALASVFERVMLDPGSDRTIILRPRVVGRTDYRIAPPPGVDWEQLGERTEVLRTGDGGTVLYRNVVIGALEGRVSLAPGTYWYEVDALGGFAGSGSFVVPTPDGEAAVFEVTRSH